MTTAIGQTLGAAQRCASISVRCSLPAKQLYHHRALTNGWFARTSEGLIRPTPRRVASISTPSYLSARFRLDGDIQRLQLSRGWPRHSSSDRGLRSVGAIRADADGGTPEWDEFSDDGKVDSYGDGDSSRSRDRGGRFGSYKGSRKDDFQSTRVFVTGLSYNTEWTGLKDHFKQAGEVVYASVSERQDGSSKGCGIVQFGSADEALDAIEMLDGSGLDGRFIGVREDRQESNRRGVAREGSSGDERQQERRAVGAPRPGSREWGQVQPTRPGDWECVECGFSPIFASRSECFKCGAPRPSGAGDASRGNSQERYDPRSSRGQDMRPGDWECPGCGFAPLFASRRECFKCGEPKPDSAGGDDWGYNQRDQRGDRGSWGQRGDRGSWGRQPETRPGDWECPGCGFFPLFSTKRECIKCGEPNPNPPSRGGNWGDDRRSEPSRWSRQDQTQEMRPGDWECPGCGFAPIFASKRECFKCGEPRPAGAGQRDDSWGYEERDYGGGGRGGSRDRGGRGSSDRQQETRPGDWECSSCGFTPIFASKTECFKCGEPRRW
ncbi:hypothetical protein CYMTET_10396 [Cymbomonas tetramitiformis]|uniref:Uncharacterized protein n=1 Tax=Cymbomonas tetramitiformis TaxID=36881 RepID=A0AAE0GPP8_9CHLO|nr:hypothetical protein CYMTET_10396 [Cymbomonas tetramitiformis]